MEMKDVKKRLFNYFTIVVPVVGLIVSLLSYIYFVLINKQTTFAALAYVSIPFIGGVLIALPFWIIVHRARKNGGNL
ncbi:MAG: hypothetical protein ABF723_11680 [Lentilactobacillus hilgardii]|uniref:hypothetical protein n=1 Tax=Lentilactobacillus hilgardii TaxID=1588 RepID=UPI001CC1CE1E|nr:hypothetical protein [Lentilactobacillus hilgardii]MBZ2200928.1 hypothetical protein [Lentilactobacillus hilgardii]MBZ2204975.1 hypothetical protein [Lentilactobacillus hilgardii]